MTRKVFLLEVFLTAIVSLAIVLLYPHLPDRIVTHWNSDLQPNGYSPKWTFFLWGPGLMVALMLFTRLGPWLSPKKFKVENFRSTYDLMMLVLFCALAYCSLVMLWAGAGHRLDAGRAIQGGICVLFVLLGNSMGKVRRNFFIGIRTPWALASERVWYPTHRLAGKTLTAGGLLGLTFTWMDLRGWPIYVLVAAALTPAIYSLVYYKRLEARGEL